MNSITLKMIKKVH